MARLGVTYQDVANAADQIVGQGKQPTIELIRNLLGTGSTTTIANHLRKWRSEQDGSTSVAAKENLPQEFVSVMKGLWQKLQAHADQQVSSVKQDAEKTISQLEQELDKQKSSNQHWQKMHDTWVKDKDVWIREKLELEQGIVTLQKDNAALTAKTAADQHRIAELNHLHKLAQNNLEHFRESTRVQRLQEQEKQGQQLQQLELSLKNTEQSLAKTIMINTHLKSQLDIVSHEKTNLQKAYDEIVIQLNALQTAFAALKQDQHEAQQNAKHWQFHHTILEKKYNEQGVFLMEQQKLNAVMNEQLSVARDEVKQLKEQNQFIAREKWEISQEKAQLEGVNKQLQKMVNSKDYQATETLA